MTDAHIAIMRRAVPLWIASGLVLGLVLFAAGTRDVGLIRASLVATAVFSLVGVAFGVWAGRRIARG